MILRTHCPFLYPSWHSRASGAVFGTWPQARSYASLVSMPRPKVPVQPSMRIAMQQQMKEAGMPNDVGLLDGTFIMPTGRNKPSFFRMPKERLSLEWYRTKSRVMDVVRLLVYKFGTKPRPVLGRRSIPAVAQALHTQMYTAFAEGDVATLEKICADGLLESFRRRIELRPPHEKLRWTLHKYRFWNKIVSHKAGTIPNMTDAGLRQAVVKVRSRQSLEKLDSEGNPISGTGPAQEKVEYVVVQRKMWAAKEQEWMVWGTVAESDWKQAIFAT